MKNKINYPQKNLYKEIASHCGVTERYIRMIDQKKERLQWKRLRRLQSF